jgi:trigger factor
LNARVATRVEELPDDRVRVTVEVSQGELHHAVEHAASDLAASVKIPGFRKGKVPLPVLVSRVGKQRLYSEAVESHIGGWFRNAAARERLRPVARPDYDYELPESPDEEWSFTATVAVQPKVEVADWTALEVPELSAEVPEELVDDHLEALRASVAELAPVEGRPVREGDTLVVDLVADGGEAQRDYVVDVGAGRLVDEVEQALVGMSAGESRHVDYETGDGETRPVDVTVKEIKERVLPPLDDDLARAASEFDTLAELRDDIEQRLGEQIEEEVENQFRAAAADALVDASAIRPAGPLVDARAQELLLGLVRSLEQRGVSTETYLAVTNQTAEQVQERMRAEAALSVARELALEAVADKLDLQVDDEELEAFIRTTAAEAGDEDADAVIARMHETGRDEQLRDDLRLRKALDRVAADVTRIEPELARARDKLWTPEKEKRPGDTKLWTPGSKEPA